MAMKRIDPDADIPIYSPVCMFCRHLRPDGERQCAAFPEPRGIPLEIWRGENPHTDPYPGDNGIRFEPAEEGEDAP